MGRTTNALKLNNEFSSFSSGGRECSVSFMILLRMTFCLRSSSGVMVSISVAASSSIYFTARSLKSLLSNFGLMGIVKANKTDRKSTRLNSSHVAISYAVFCLKKKKFVPLSAASTHVTARPTESTARYDQRQPERNGHPFDKNKNLTDVARSHSLQVHHEGHASK